MKLVIEMISYFFSDLQGHRFDVWSNSADLAGNFHEQSYGLKLRNAINHTIDSWMNSQSHRRCWMLKASEIFGGAYDSNLHADLNLTSRRKDITGPRIKSLMMAQAVWGLCVHVPLQRFFNLFLNRHQELQTTYHDRIDTPQNKFYPKFLN